jgi:hypothetical protein
VLPQFLNRAGGDRELCGTLKMANSPIASAPGEEYKYVMSLAAAAIGLAGVGGGRWSLDHGLGWFDLPGWPGFGIALGAGIGGAEGL